MRRAGLLAFVVIIYCSAQSAIGQQTDSQRCESIRRSVTNSLSWKRVAPGLEYGEVRIEGLKSKTKAPESNVVVLVRYSNKQYQTEVFDMRRIGKLNRLRGIYAPPLYALAELENNLKNFVVISSAGYTRSYSQPIPAGFLRVDRHTSAKFAGRDQILNGVVCVHRKHTVTIASSFGGDAERLVHNVSKCESGFQAGPVLIERNKPLPLKGKGESFPAWVSLATAGGYTTILWSTLGDFVSMSCALSSPKIGANAAIRLQSYSLGGLILSPAFRNVARETTHGNVNGSVASALIVRGR